MIVSAPGEGERLHTGGAAVLVKGVRPDLCVSEWTFDGPTDGPEPHRHDGVDSLYVLEGGLDVTVDGAERAAGPATLVSVPRGVRHTYAHRGAGTTRILSVHTPDGGFADFMRRNADLSR